MQLTFLLNCKSDHVQEVVTVLSKVDIYLFIFFFRVKQITFLKDSFSMELPKQMVILDIGLSVLYMNFDPFSCKSKFFYPRPEKKVVDELPVPVIDIGVEVCV